MITSSSLKRSGRGFPKERRSIGLSLAALGLLGVAILVVGWTLVGWPVLAAAGVAALVVRFF